MSPLLIFALILIVLFAGLGLFIKVLWWGLIIGVVLAIADLVLSRSRPR